MRGGRRGRQGGRLLLLLVAGALTAAVFPLTLTDALDRPVTLARPPARIVSLAPNLTEMLFALGLGDRVIGVTDFCDYPPAARSRTSIGGMANPSLERIVGLRPDLVIGIRGNPTTTFHQLDRARVPAFALDPETLTEVLDAIRTIGQLADADDAAGDLVHRLQGRLGAVRARLGGLRTDARPRVLFVMSCTPQIWTCGRDTFLDDVIWRAGGRSITSDRKDFHPISMEAVLRRQPDIIVVTEGMSAFGQGSSIEAFRQLPGAQSLRAVREGRVVSVPGDPLLRPGPRLVEGVETLARALHPAVFDD